MYELKGTKISVTVDSCKNTVKIANGKTEWNMTEEPFVKFSDESVWKLTSPVKVAEFDTVTSKGISFEYENIAEKGISLKTTVELEKATDNIKN